MRPRVIVAGAGLGGSIVADALAETHDVTVVELGRAVLDMQARVDDVAVPARLDPHVGAGPGGTTALWHNGLIEIDERVFAERWPFPKATLAPYYARAYPLLGGIERAQLEAPSAELRRRHAQARVDAEASALLYCPVGRRNLWESLGLEGRVRRVTGEVTSLELDGDRARAVLAKTPDGELRLEADEVVLAAGGLGTPGILQSIEHAAPGLRNAGRFYEDHPMGFVGLARLRAPLYRFWNWDVPGTDGFLRMPLIVVEDGLQVSFQLRPAALFLGGAGRERMGSMLTKLRNEPFNPLHYLRVLRHGDDLLDVLSLRFGIKIPTRHYSLLMVAEQPPADARAVSLERGRVRRRWELPPAYLATLSRAIERFVAGLGDVVISSQIFPRWADDLQSAAHHSGTARMSRTPEDGVCDADARVHGLANVSVADGSLIPGSGIANTGLTIAALALRLADRLRGARA